MDLWGPGGEALIVFVEFSPQWAQYGLIIRLYEPEYKIL
jgi:hypothetical protein